MANSIQYIDDSANHLLIPTTRWFRSIDPDDLLYIEADNMYTRVYLTNSENFFGCVNLGNFEANLRGDKFVRVHKSFIVNTYKIKEFLKKKSGMIVVENETEIPVSRTRKKAFLQALNLAG